MEGVPFEPDGHCPCITSHLLAVARQDVQKVRHGAEQRDKLNGLVSRSIFANADGIVCRRVDDMKMVKGT